MLYGIGAFATSQTLLEWRLKISQYGNALLRSLSPQTLDRLGLRPVAFKLRQDIEVPGEPVRSLIFVETGMASMTTLFRDGSEVEVGMFGHESVIGVSALMGSLQSLNRVYTQVAGHGYRSSIKQAGTEFSLGGDFQKLMLGYVQAQLLQSMQSTGCNAKHSIEQRLARWLLLCVDRTNETTFTMPHAFLAQMLGSRRTTVTIAATSLKEAGFIRYSRGTVEVLDVKGLEARSCECYRVIRNHLQSMTAFASNIVA